MTEEKAAPKKPDDAPKEKETVKKKEPVVPAKAKRSGPLYGFVTFLVLTGTALVVWQERGQWMPPSPAAPASPAVSPAAKHALLKPAEMAAGEEMARFRLLKQELTELRNSHEALAKEFLQAREEIRRLKETAISVPASPETPPAPVTVSSALPGVAPVVPDAESLVALNARIDALQKAYDAQTGSAGKKLRLLAVLDDIRLKAEAGESYGAEFAEFQKLQGEGDAVPRAAVHVLQQNAAQGVPTMAELITVFSETAQLAIPASISGKEKPGFGDRLRAQLSHLITIRKVDVDADDNSDEADIARAEAELQVGNVDMAITHLQQLSDPTKSLFAGWIKQANQYLDTQDALQSLKNLILEKPAPAPANAGIEPSTDADAPDDADPALE